MQPEVVHSVSVLRILRDGPPERLSLTFWFQSDGIEARIQVAARDLGRVAFGAQPIVESDLHALSETHPSLNGALRLQVMSLDNGTSVGMRFFREIDTLLYVRISPEHFLEALSGDTVEALVSHWGATPTLTPEQNIDDGYAFGPR